MADKKEINHFQQKRKQWLMINVKCEFLSISIWLITGMSSSLFMLVIIFLSTNNVVGSKQDLILLPSSTSTSSSVGASVTPCPVKCFRTNPVCGVNNVTYWCGCAEAVCAGTRVAKIGFCEFENEPALLSGQALLLVHILWLILLGFFVLFGLL